jgi:SAM-dependent methyltransferase
MADAVGKRFFPEIEAGGFSRLDGTVQFYQRINALIRPDAVVMDYGAGRGASQTDDPAQFRRHLVTLKGRVRELIGADVDPAVKSNASLDRAILVGPDGRLPLPDASIDVIVSDFTFEHVQDPASVARELDRVLVGGGGFACERQIGTDISHSQIEWCRSALATGSFAWRSVTGRTETPFRPSIGLIPQRPSRSTSHG